MKIKTVKTVIIIVLFGLMLSSCDKKNALLVNRRTAIPENIEKIKKAQRANASSLSSSSNSSLEPPRITSDNYGTLKLYRDDNGNYLYKVWTPTRFNLAIAHMSCLVGHWSLGGVSQLTISSN